MAFRREVTDRHGRVWVATKVHVTEAELRDFEFWYRMDPEDRVAAVEAALESSLKAQGWDGVPRLRRVLAALNENQVRYLIAGAHAVAYHAIPRATKDLDVLVDPTHDNAGRLLSSLRQFFGGADLGYSIDDVVDPKWILQIGVAPVRIDILSAMRTTAESAICA